MSREIVTEEASVDLARRQGWLSEKMMYVGKKGAPDRHFYKAGVLMIVEFKKRGKDLDGHQVRRARELSAAGFTVHVIDNFEDFVALLAEYEAKIAARA